MQIRNSSSELHPRNESNHGLDAYVWFKRVEEAQKRKRLKRLKRMLSRKNRKRNWGKLNREIISFKLGEFNLR